MYNYSCQSYVNFLNIFSKITHLANFLKICRVGTEMFHVNGQAERHDEAISPFLHFVQVLNKAVFINVILPVLCMKWKITNG